MEEFREAVFGFTRRTTVRPSDLCFSHLIRLGLGPLDPTIFGFTGTASTFYAPWNNTYYEFGWYPVAGSTVASGTALCVAQSKNIINWSFVTGSPTNGCFSGLFSNGTSGVAPGSVFYDDSTGCPAQDYTCLHVILQEGTSPDGFLHNGEMHPTNASLTAWSTAVEFSGTINNAGISWDPNLFKYNSDGNYYLLHDESDSYTESYYLYTATTLAGPYTKVSSTPYTGSGVSTGCHLGTGHGCESGGILQSDTGTYRLYFHDTLSGAGMNFMETSNPTQVPGTWTTPVQLQGANDFSLNRAQVFRTADMRTTQQVAASARQTIIPFNTPRGLMIPEAQTYSGPANTGSWFGFEHVLSSNNPSQSYDALHIVGPSNVGGGQNIDIGNHPDCSSNYCNPASQRLPFSLWAHFDPSNATFPGNMTAQTIYGTTYHGITRSCVIEFGDDGASSPLATGNIQPEKSLCKVSQAAYLKEVDVMVDSGASTVQVGYRHNGSTTALTGTLTPTTVSGITDKVACANTSGTAVTIEGNSVTCGTLSATALASGDFIETLAGAGDGTSKRMTITVLWQEN